MDCNLRKELPMTLLLVSLYHTLSTNSTETQSNVQRIGVSISSTSYPSKFSFCQVICARNARLLTPSS